MLKRLALCGVAALFALGGVTSCDSCGGKWHVVQLKLTNVADHVRMELTEAGQKQYDGSDPFCERDGALPGA